MAERVTPFLQADGTMICRRCSATLGKNHDNIFLQFGTVKFFDRAKFFCCFCGKRYTWCERSPDNDITKPSYQVLNKLGRAEE